MTFGTGIVKIIIVFCAKLNFGKLKQTLINLKITVVEFYLKIISKILNTKLNTRGMEEQYTVEYELYDRLF